MTNDNKIIIQFNTPFSATPLKTSAALKSTFCGCDVVDKQAFKHLQQRNQIVTKWSEDSFSHNILTSLAEFITQIIWQS